MNPITSSSICCCFPIHKKKNKTAQYETFISTRRTSKEMNDIFFSAIKQTQAIDIPTSRFDNNLVNKRHK